MRRKILDPLNNQIEVLKVPWYPQQDIEWTCMVNSIKMCLEYMKNTYNNRIIRDIVPNMSIDDIMKITNTRRFTGTSVDSHFIKNLNSNIEGIIFSLEEEVSMKKLSEKIEKGIPRALFQNPVMPVIILDADFTDLRICCLKFASIGVNRILKITGK